MVIKKRMQLNFCSSSWIPKKLSSDKVSNVRVKDTKVIFKCDVFVKKATKYPFTNSQI